MREGTPLQNSVVDIFSLFAFLGKKIVNPLHKYPEFKAKIEQPLKNKRAKIAMARLTVRSPSVSSRSQLMLYGRRSCSKRSCSDAR